jgi:hypothetical protein
MAFVDSFDACCLGNLCFYENFHGIKS